MKKFSRKQKEIIAIIIITVFFITSLLLDACLLHPFSWIISKNEDMFKELFAVQATISTLDPSDEVSKRFVEIVKDIQKEFTKD